MKYPENMTNSKPVTGEQAKKQLAAMEAGGLITEEGKQLAERIRARQQQDGKEQERQVQEQ